MTTTITPANLATLIEKTSHYDKDERYMATSDITQLLQQGQLKLDANIEKKVCAAILKQLEDTSNDVQSVAVKALPLLVSKSQQQQVVDICIKLCDMLLTGKAELRDVYSIGLKTCIANLSPENGPVAAKRMVGPLLNGGKRPDHALECLDVMCDLLTKFGTSVSEDHANCAQVALAQLAASRSVVRKRAMSCLGILATITSDKELSKTMDILLESINNVPGTSKKAKTTTATTNTVEETVVVQTIGTIGRTAGNRLSSYVERIVPLVVKHLQSSEVESMQNDAGDEMREICFQALDSLVLRCPKEITPHLVMILTKCKEFMQYDPNFNTEAWNGDDDDDQDAAMDVDSDGGGGGDAYSDYGGDGGGGGGDDDDDTSWKVRRAAIKVLDSIIVSRPELLDYVFKEMGDALLARFREREESVRVEVMSAFAHMYSSAVTHGGGGNSSTLTRHSSMTTTTTTTTSPARPTRTPMLILLQEKTGKVIKAVNRILAETPKKEAKSQVEAYRLLNVLVATLRGGLDDTFATLVPNMVNCLGDIKHSAMRLETLTFLRSALDMHSPAITQPHALTLKAPLLKCVNADWYKIVAESLRCLSALALKVNPVAQHLVGGAGGDVVMVEMPSTTTVSPEQFVAGISTVLMPRLAARDIDQEIKAVAIECTGVFLHLFGDSFDKADEFLGLLLERCKNDSTRLFALRALALVAQTNASMRGVTAVSLSAARDVAIFLRQQSRELRLQAMVTLTALVDSKHAAPLDQPTAAAVFVEVAKLVTDKDVHLATPSLILARICVVKGGPQVVNEVKTNILAPATDLARSSLVRGTCLEALQNFFEACAQSPVIGFEVVWKGLWETAMKMAATSTTEHTRTQPSVAAAAAGTHAPLEKNSLTSISECLAVVASVNSSNEPRDRLVQVVTMMENNKPIDQPRIMRCICILAVGGVGKRISLAGRNPPIQQVLLSVFDESDEDLKTAAAGSLGRCAVGDTATFLPIVISAITTKNKGGHQYLLLLSLREMLDGKAGGMMLDSTYLAPHLPTLMQALEAQQSVEDEGVRSIVAECFGKLAVIAPTQLVPKLAATGGDKLGRWTRITAIKFAFAFASSTSTEMKSRTATIDALQANFIPAVAAFFNDDDLDTQRAALQTLNSLVHHFPYLVPDIFSSQHKPTLSEILVSKTVVRPELQRKVDFGPFKQTVDDGLPIRKVVFSCISTILDHVPEMFSPFGQGDLFKALIGGLLDCPGDLPDVAFLCHQIIAQLVVLAPLVVAANFSSGLCANLIATLDKKVDAKDPEVAERKAALCRSALRCADLLVTIPGAMENRPVQEMIDVIHKQPLLKEMAEAEGLMNVVVVANKSKG